MLTLWLSSEKMTISVRIDVDNGRVVEAPPIARKFVGQHYLQLMWWMKKQGDFTREVLENVQPAHCNRDCRRRARLSQKEIL